MSTSLLRPLLVAAAICALAATAFYLLCLNHVSINKVGIAYDSQDGSITVQKPGWHLTGPLTRTTTLSTLPFRVDLAMGTNRSVPERVMTTKLVRFRPEHMEAFIETEGFHWMTHSMDYTFAPYAFSGKTFPFLEVIQ